MYVGSAVDIKNRWAVHNYQLKNGTHHSPQLQRSYLKHGDFDWDIIEYVEDVEKLIEREQVWLDFFKPEYNSVSIAGSRLGTKHSLETKQKMSLSRKGKKRSAETIEKIVKYHKNKKRSVDSCAKMSQAQLNSVHRERMAIAVANANRNRVHTNESKQKRSAAMKAYWAAKKEQQ